MNRNRGGLDSLEVTAFDAEGKRLIEFLGRYTPGCKDTDVYVQCGGEQRHYRKNS